LIIVLKLGLQDTSFILVHTSVAPIYLSTLKSTKSS
jgi:hypothetical protein